MGAVFGVYALSVGRMICEILHKKKEIMQKNVGDANLRVLIGERLREERERLDLKPEAFQDVGAGFSRRSVYDWEAGRTSPKAEFLALAGDTGIDVSYILTGVRNTAQNSKSRNLSGAVTTPADDEDTVYLSVMSACGSMGPGNELLTEDVLLGEVPFSRRWLSLNIPGCRPDALRLIHAYGDSMAGTLNSGDFAVIDTSCCTVDYPGVYLLHVNRLLFIKRVSFRMDGRMVVSSDNPAAPMAEVLDGGHQLDVRGRVVYGWNGKRF